MMFTLTFLKGLEKNDLTSKDVQNDIVNQLRLFENETIAMNDDVILDTIDSIEKSIGFLSCLEYEKKEELIPDRINILEAEIKQLVSLIERKSGTN